MKLPFVRLKSFFLIALIVTCFANLSESVADEFNDCNKNAKCHEWLNAEHDRVEREVIKRKGNKANCNKDPICDEWLKDENEKLATQIRNKSYEDIDSRNMTNEWRKDFGETQYLPKIVEEQTEIAPNKNNADSIFILLSLGIVFLSFYYFVIAPLINQGELGFQKRMEFYLRHFNRFNVDGSVNVTSFLFSLFKNHSLENDKQLKEIDQAMNRYYISVYNFEKYTREVRVKQVPRFIPSIVFLIYSCIAISEFIFGNEKSIAGLPYIALPLGVFFAFRAYGEIKIYIYPDRYIKSKYAFDNDVKNFIESEQYKDIYSVCRIIFKERGIFTQDEISKFFDNELELFNASFEKIKSGRESYINETSFKELILVWSEEHMRDMVRELFNGVPKTESSIADKYISSFGQFKDYLGIVQSTLQLDFDLNSALDRKYDQLKTVKNESLLKDILAKGTYGKNQIAISDLDFMDGIEFEHFLSVLFRKMGYRAEVTKASGDQGVDLILQDINFKYAVQAKRYSDKVSNSAIQEVFAGMKFYNCNKGMVVTTNYFTASAVALAQKNGVELIDRNKLNDFLVKHIIYQSDIDSVEMVKDDVS